MIIIDTLPDNKSNPNSKPNLDIYFERKTCISSIEYDGYIRKNIMNVKDPNAPIIVCDECFLTLQFKTCTICTNNPQNMFTDIYGIKTVVEDMIVKEGKKKILEFFSSSRSNVEISKKKIIKQIKDEIDIIKNHYNQLSSQKSFTNICKCPENPESGFQYCKYVNDRHKYIIESLNRISKTLESYTICFTETYKCIKILDITIEIFKYM